MKNKIVILFLMMMLTIIPFKINAQGVGEIYVSGNKTVQVGKDIELSFNVEYLGITKDGVYGIGGYTYQIEFDEKILKPISINKGDFFDTKIYKDENNKYHVVGIINKENNSKNKCSDNVLYCSNIKDTIKFRVLDTSSNNTNVVIQNVSSYLYKIGYDISSLNRKIIDSIKTSNYKLTIKSGKANNDKLDNIIEEVKRSNIESLIETGASLSKDNDDENNNNYLKSLEISGYPIEFDKHLISYDIYIEDGVNSIDVKAKSENEKASVLIEGNDDLKANNNRVRIVVTSINGEKKVYMINTLVKEEEVKDNSTPTEDINKIVKKVQNKIDDKTIRILKIVGCSLFAIILIVILIKIIINSKLNKKFKNFDKF